MESFEAMFMAGGHKNSLGRSKEVFDIVKSNPSRMQELVDCISADDAWVRMRAIDTFEKLVRENPEVGKPYTGLLVDELAKSNQPSIQWHLAQIFMVIELSRVQQEKVVQWLKSTVSTLDVDWIVSANVMKALLYFYKRGLLDAEELRHLLKLQSEHKSKTVRKKAESFLEYLG